MYLWIGLGVEESKEKEIRTYCKEINKNYGVNEQSFTLPQHISLKTSFQTENYEKIINDLKNMFLKSKKMELEVKEVEMVPGVIWLNIKETKELRNYHNLILDYLKNNYGIEKVGFDGDTFKFHSTLFQDIDNKELVQKLYEALDKNKLKNNNLIINKLYFGISEVGKVGTYKVVDEIELVDNIKEINNVDMLNDCLKVMQLSYKNRDEKLNINNTHSHSQMTIEELKNRYENGTKMYGYYQEEKIVAFLALEHKAEEIKIKDIAVLPEYQGKGIGKELLDYAKDQAIKNNKSKIILGFIYNNKELKEWYEKYGFKIVEIVEYPETGKVGKMEYIIK